MGRSLARNVGRGARAASATGPFPKRIAPNATRARRVWHQRCSAAAEGGVRAVLETLADRQDLTFDEAKSALDELVEDGDPARMAAFLVLMRAKGETGDELAGLATAMKERMTRVKVDKPVVDIVGTGGDSAGTVNISTGSCVLTSACGISVAKHGGRSVSSLCGSADVLENLGVVIDLGPEQTERCLDEAGICFMFAPNFHPAMKAVVPVRRALKIRTAFNVLGPMLNPAEAPYALVGVYSTAVQKLMADSLYKLGIRKALVVNSMGIDELTPAGPADVVEVGPGGIKSFVVDPKDLGIPRCEIADLKGGDAALNAQILKDVFGGQKGAVADALCLNAGFALATAEVAADPKEGVAMAREVQESGRALEIMQKWANTTQALAGE